MPEKLTPAQRAALIDAARAGRIYASVPRSRYSPQGYLCHDYRAVRSLTEKGLLETDNRQHTITDRGREVAEGLK